MAKDSKIEWTHHTFNPWWGCSKVSPACRNCYAEAWAKRVGQDVWGQYSKRRFFGESHWKEPIKWNEEAKIDGKKRRVFCASMADVFESRAELNPSRNNLWNLIEKTPMLNWLLLTKRPQNIQKMAPWKNKWPKNVWIGTTVETQTWAVKRLPYLLEIPAAVRFLSCEPLLGPLDLSPWLKTKNKINWLIAGGESGPKARPMHPEWVRSLRDQCVDNHIAFHFKQWGHWAPKEIVFETSKRIIEFQGSELVAAGKKDAGRELDGSFWDELPNAA
jgi:protein gp37